MKLGFMTACLPEMKLGEIVKWAKDKGFGMLEVACWPRVFEKRRYAGLATNPEIWRRMFDAIPSDYFGLNLDPSHLIWQQIDYVKVI